MIAVICILVGYLLGSVPSGYLVARAHGIDIQKVGSGNIGAANILRAVGIAPALIVVVSDPLKGLLAVLIAQWVGLGPWLVAATGFAAILGNSFNIFLRMKGGKGVATSLGVFIGVAPAAAIAGAIIGLLTMYLGRYVSLGSLVGLFSAPLILALRTYDLPALTLGITIFLLALYRHRENVRRLADGNERRIGDKKKKPSGDETVRDPSAPTDTHESSRDAAPPVQPELSEASREPSTAETEASESPDAESSDTESPDTESPDTESSDVKSPDTESSGVESPDTESPNTESSDVAASVESSDAESSDAESSDAESATESSDTEETRANA